MTADSKPPSPNARTSRLRLLVAVLLVPLSVGGGLGGGDLPAAAAAGSPSPVLTSQSDEVPVNASAVTVIANRSVRRRIRRRAAPRRLMSAPRRWWIAEVWMPLHEHPMLQMWRGPPVVRL